MSVTLKQLEAFVWVADLGSFRAAAERLNTTQPNISARIATLETTLNVTLMDRDPGSVRLTTKGHQLLEHARRVLRETEALIETSGQAQLFDGTLRLGVTEMIVHTWLRDYLRAFRERYPNISVELTVDLSASLEKELFARTIDLALQNGPFTRSATGVADIGRYPLIWVAAPQLGLHENGRLSGADLARHPILTHARGTRPYLQVADHFRGLPDVSARLVPSSNLAAGMQMAMDGMGVAAIPAAMVVRELAAGELVRVAYPWAPEDLDFVARYDARTCPAYVSSAADLASHVAEIYDQMAAGTQSSKDKFF